MILPLLGSESADWRGNYRSFRINRDISGADQTAICRPCTGSARPEPAA